MNKAFVMPKLVKLVRNYLMLKLISFCMLFAYVSPWAHNDGTYYHDTGDLPKRNNWMKNIPDYRRLNKISMPGTHDSGSRYGGDAIQTQTLTLRQQLDAGIRFLDIRIVHENNKFNIYHGIAFQNYDFGQVLSDVTNFLAENNSEVILMRVRQESAERNNTRSFSETFDEYFKSYGKFFSNINNDYNPALCQIRGKIILFADNVTFPAGWSLSYSSAFDIQDEYNVTTNWDLHGKVLKVLEHINKANSSYKTSNKIFLNYASGSGGSFPYFVASGHSSPGTGADRLSTGLTTPGFKDSYPFFPRVSCFIGICTIAFEGTNTLARDHMLNLNIQYAGIIAADFPGADLINALITRNPTAFSAELNDQQNACPP